MGLKSIGGDSAAPWTTFLEDTTRRGLKAPALLIVDGAPGLGAAVSALWPDVPVQRCTVHKHRNLLTHAPKRLHDELTEDDRDVIYAETAAEVEAKRKAFLRTWRLKCRAAADSLEEACERLFTFIRLAARAVEVGPDHERDRAAPRGVQAPHQASDRPARGRDGAHALPGTVGLGADHHA